MKLGFTAQQKPTLELDWASCEMSSVVKYACHHMYVHLILSHTPLIKGSYS